MYMFRYDDLIIINDLMKKLNGFRELSEKIIIFKNDLELEKIKEEYIERDFYNWLTHDLSLRKDLALNNLDHIQSYILDYYTDLNLLGLQKFDDCRRTTSLTESFNSKWWLTTEKRIKWIDIHYFINEINFIKILDSERDYNDAMEYFDINEWITPNILFIVKALNYIEYCSGYNKHKRGDKDFYTLDGLLFVRI